MVLRDILRSRIRVTVSVSKRQWSDFGQLNSGFMLGLTYRWLPKPVGYRKSYRGEGQTRESPGDK